MGFNKIMSGDDRRFIVSTKDGIVDIDALKNIHIDGDVTIRFPAIRIEHELDAELEQLNANIAYLSMMAGVDMLPMEDDSYMMLDVDLDATHSKKFDLVKGYYDRRLWNRTMVMNAIDRWITLEEAEEILGDDFLM